MDQAREPELVFYDGGCGLCHASVRFVAARDRGGTRFRFAPLGGETFAAKRVGEATHTGGADSVVVRRRDGALLTKSGAAIHILRRLGGVWAGLGWAAAWVPKRVRDGVYDRVAAVRHRVFGRRTEACPGVPAGMRERFLP
ncbi:MAG: DCC1-like thiol-disulfide oxidoreductase family protein [Planctomycetota bacterium]